MTEEAILVALGANLPSTRFGSPRQTCEAAIAEIGRRSIVVADRSRWYHSAPVPPSDQPPYVNGVVRLETTLAPLALMTTLLAIEREFGRVRGRLNAPRILDLDLLAYGDRHLGRSRGRSGSSPPPAASAGIRAAAIERRLRELAAPRVGPVGTGDAGGSSGPPGNLHAAAMRRLGTRRT